MCLRSHRLSEERPAMWSLSGTIEMEFTRLAITCAGKHIRLTFLKLFHLLSILHVCAVRIYILHNVPAVVVLLRRLDANMLLLFKVKSANRRSWFPGTFDSITERWQMAVQKLSSWQHEMRYNPSQRSLFWDLLRSCNLLGILSESFEINMISCIGLPYKNEFAMKIFQVAFRVQLLNISNQHDFESKSR